MLPWKWLRSRWLAVTFLVCITVLFFLPGSALPKETWFSKINIDKWVHVGFFAALYFLWRTAFDLRRKHYSIILLTLIIIYGLLVELVQKHFVPNRDFDLLDLLCDATGSILGLIVWWWVYKKNKPL
jgi:VanZ family protein